MELEYGIGEKNNECDDDDLVPHRQQPQLPNKHNVEYYICGILIYIILILYLETALPIQTL